MKSLIIGSQGLVGSALKKCLPSAIEGVQVDATKKNQIHIDITKYETMFKAFSEHRPQIVYLPAAIAHVDKCEDLGTNVVNVRGAITVLRLCEQFEAKLVYFSSSYVFDGTAEQPYRVTDETHPINNYGKQKEAVENQILQSDLRHVIIRTVGVFGEERRKKNFGKQVVSAIFSGKKVFAPTDQKMNPILSVDLARVSVKLAEKEHGLFHVAGDECLTKYEFAKRIAKGFQLDKLVIGVTTEEMKQRAPRPKMGCLNCDTLRNFGIDVPSFERGLAKFYELEFNG